MKAFLLSAGLGTRLRPLTNDIPKCLLPVGGTPLLYIWLDLLEKEGVDDVLINIHHMPEKILDAVKNRKNKIRIELAYEEYLKGSAGTIRDNYDYVKNEEDFYVLYSDNLSNISLKEIYDFHKSLSSVFSVYVYDTDKPKQKGIFTADKNGKVNSFEEKPLKPKSHIANSGLGVLNKKIFKYFNGQIPCDLGKDIMPMLIGNMFIKKSRYIIEDIGTMEDYNKFRNIQLNKFF